MNHNQSLGVCITDNIMVTRVIIIFRSERTKYNYK